MAKDDFLEENAEDTYRAASLRVPVFAYERSPEERSYSPFIGLAIAPTWGDLARWVNRLRAEATSAARLWASRRQMGGRGQCPR